MATTLKGKGMAYSYDDTRQTPCSCCVQISAQFDSESMAYVVNGPDNRSRGFRQCWFAGRPVSCDHKRRHQLKHEGKPMRDAHLRVWDFLIVRADGSSVRLHPQWSTTDVGTFAGEGHPGGSNVQPAASGRASAPAPTNTTRGWAHNES